MEDFFYYDPMDLAIHGLLFFYECAPLSLTPLADDRVMDDDVEQPRWIPISALAAECFQSHGEITMQMIAQVKNRP